MTDSRILGMLGISADDDIDAGVPNIGFTLTCSWSEASTSGLLTLGTVTLMSNGSCFITGQRLKKPVQQFSGIIGLACMFS